jgi:hypothetical protein
MTYNPNKKIKIEIRQCVLPTHSYEIWDVNKSRCIDRDADECQIEYLLESKDYDRFKSGKFIFVVSAIILSNSFQYLY